MFLLLIKKFVFLCWFKVFKSENLVVTNAYNAVQSENEVKIKTRWTRPSAGPSLRLEFQDYCTAPLVRPGLEL